MLSSMFFEQLKMYGTFNSAFCIFCNWFLTMLFKSCHFCFVFVSCEVKQCWDLIFEQRSQFAKVPLGTCLIMIVWHVVEKFATQLMSKVDPDSQKFLHHNHNDWRVISCHCWQYIADFHRHNGTGDDVLPSWHHDCVNFFLDPQRNWSLWYIQQTYCQRAEKLSKPSMFGVVTFR